MSDYKPITGELRANVCTESFAGQQPSVVRMEQERFERLCDAIDAIHAQLERENAELRAARGDDWIKLPVDADGLPIHVGDMLAGEKASGFGLCEPFEVGCIMFGRDIVQVNDTHRLTRCTEFAHHYVPDTWERIIEDAVNVHGNGFNPLWPHDRDSLVARCKKLAGEAE